MKFFRKSSLLAMLFMGLSFQPVSALTINGTFQFNPGQEGTGIGGGDLVSVFNAAAGLWENLIADNDVVNITYQWGNVGGALATATTSGSGGVITSRVIRFSRTRSDWFFDASPFDNAEWNTFNSSSVVTGGDPLEIERRFTGANAGQFNTYDLLSVAIHEIGHTLGFTTLFTSGNIDAPAGTPFAPYTIISDGAHLDPFFYPNANMSPSIANGQRKLISQVDLLAVCAKAGYTQCDYAGAAGEPGAPVPEPSTWVLMIAGFLSLTWLRRRRAA